MGLPWSVPGIFNTLIDMQIHKDNICCIRFCYLQQFGVTAFYNPVVIIMYELGDLRCGFRQWLAQGRRNSLPGQCV